ncbi:nickel ABC transporter substrate-binding protein [Streptococcus sp. zg-JUN1979]|uniref:nickel ABC transporter substrate-binding protein n=1 Tax=Streptococcus sp. zg-JUN1979 TaxID=3391450 RepID=UPI0039A5A117
MNKRQLFYGLLVACLLCVMVTTPEAHASSKSNSTLHYGSTKDIGDLNPHLYSGEMAAQNMIYERLVACDGTDIKPALATSWDISDDGLTYTFHLRENVLFSNGDKLTAQDVKANFDAVLANKERHSWMGLINEIADTNAADDSTFVLTLKRSYYPTLTELSLVRPFGIASPKTFKNGGTKDGVTDYIGTGPYKLSSHKQNKEAVFSENPYYWGDKPKLKTIDWQVISSFQSLQLALEKGSIDLIYGSDGDQLSSDTLQSLKNNSHFSVYLSKPNAVRSVLLNTNRSALKDIAVRKAISYGIDKKEIVSGVLDNVETVANTIFPSSAPYMDKIDLKKITYNAQKANSILDKAGYVLDDKTGYRTKNGRELSLTFSCNAQNAQEESIAQVIQSQLKAIGIKVDVVSEDKQTYLARQKDGDFDMQYSLSWGAPYDPQTYLSSWAVSGNGHGDYQAQLGLAKKEWLDQEIKTAILSTNDEDRQEAYRQVMTYISDEYVYVPISFSCTKAVACSQLKGIYFPTSQYEIPFAHMYFKS